MPTYVYAPLLKDGETRACDLCAETFEITQRMSEDALSVCPTCGGAIERVIQPVNFSGHSRYNKKRSNKDLANLGFTQYKKKGKGYYEKQFGSGGPQTIRRGDA
jgi:putative FmdB family regulatory protein